MTTSFDITAPLNLPELTAERLTALQRLLGKLGYYMAFVDGVLGPKTRAGLVSFMKDNSLTAPEGVLTHETLVALVQAVDKLKVLYAPEQKNTKEGRKQIIIRTAKAHGFSLEQIAYILASAYWETNYTLRPVAEAFWMTDPDTWLRIHHPEYYPYFGRGFIQLTWKKNYAFYAALLELDLVGEPNLALGFDTALFILLHGLKTGAFTGVALSRYVNSNRKDYYGARRCVNGTDKAAEIAELAKKYERELLAQGTI